MKNLLITASVLFSVNSFAVTGTDLLNARDAAISEASVELDIDTVTAFEVTPESSDEILVAFKAGEEVHNYGCHFHGTDMACHEEDDDHHVAKSGESGFEHLEEGHVAAMAKLEKTLTRRGSDLSSVKSIKAWKLDNADSDGHEHGADVWTKVIYDLNDREYTVFVQCHEHGHGEMACHYKRTGKDEPTL
jgi:hypothetical protein